MKLSIVICNYNYEDYVGSAIDSALKVVWPDKEIIVIDDGSTDNSRDVIRSFGDQIQTVFQPNSTQLVASNVGFAMSVGDVVIFLDSDDVLEPNIAQEIIKVLRPGVSKIQFQVARIDASGRRTGTYFPFYDPLPTPKKIKRWAIKSNAYPTPPGSGNAYTRAFLEKIFPLDNSCGNAPDSCCLAAAPILGDVITIPKPLVLYRVHGKNDSNILSSPGLFAREVTRAHARFIYSQKIGKTVGIKISDKSFRKSLHTLQHRIASKKLTPDLHPLKGETTGRLITDVFYTTAFFGAMSMKNKLILFVWSLLTILSPMPIAKFLIRKRFSRI